MTTRGAIQLLPIALRMKYRSIASVTSKSLMTPSLSGRTASMLPGVLPSISFATWPTAMPSFMTLPVLVLTATTLGSLRTMPFARVQTSVLAVPRSMPRSVENWPRKRSKITRSAPWGAVGPRRGASCRRPSPVVRAPRRGAVGHGSYRQRPPPASRPRRPARA